MSDDKLGRIADALHQDWKRRRDAKDILEHGHHRNRDDLDDAMKKLDFEDVADGMLTDAEGKQQYTAPADFFGEPAGEPLKKGKRKKPRAKQRASETGPARGSF